MTDTIAHTPLPEPAAHILAADLRMFKTEEMCAQACSVAFSTPDDGRSEPLFTAQQMREYRDAPAWQPIETAPKDFTTILLLWDGKSVAGFWHPNNGKVSWYRRQNWFTHCGHSFNRKNSGPTHWQPLPAPIEQDTGEKK